MTCKTKFQFFFSKKKEATKAVGGGASDESSNQRGEKDWIIFGQHFEPLSVPMSNLTCSLARAHNKRVSTSRPARPKQKTSVPQTSQADEREKNKRAVCTGGEPSINTADYHCKCCSSTLWLAFLRLDQQIGRTIDEYQTFKLLNLRVVLKFK